jgi:hypothetical protein
MDPNPYRSPHVTEAPRNFLRPERLGHTSILQALRVGGSSGFIFLGVYGGVIGCAVGALVGLWAALREPEPPLLVICISAGGLAGAFVGGLCGAIAGPALALIVALMRKRYLRRLGYAAGTLGAVAGAVAGVWLSHEVLAQAGILDELICGTLGGMASFFGLLLLAITLATMIWDEDEQRAKRPSDACGSSSFHSGAG